MKKWPIVITSLIIALAVIAYAINIGMNAIEFEDTFSPSGGIPLPSAEIKKVTPSPAVNSATPSPKITVKPSPTPSPSVAPSPVPSPESTPVLEDTPTVQPDTTPAVSTPAPSVDALLSVINNSSYKEAKDENAFFESPVIFLDGGNIPEIVALNNVVSINGRIYCSPGTLDSVKAEIIEGEKVVQSCTYAPFVDTFSLNGSVNADLHFARLAVGDYIYRLEASAVNGTSSTSVTLIEKQFCVAVPGSAELQAANPGDTSGGYVAKLSGGTDTPDLIWNFLIGQFDNPYAAAGIMANMEAESSLNPSASQGDTPECGYGLCQWTQTRKQNLKDFAYIVSTDVSDLDLQLCFVMYELENDYPKLKTFLMNVTDGYLAAAEFYAIYEQAASPGIRCTYAKKYLDKYAVP